MLINIVTVEEAWVLRQLAENYKIILPNSKISTKADTKADINFYINYNLFENKTCIDIGYFTHRELEDKYLQARFDYVAEQVDWCIAMCKKTADYLPEKKTTILHPTPSKEFLTKENLTLGIVGREYPSGRKRFHWIEELKAIPGIEIILTNGKYSKEEMPAFYKKIDYLLILSDNEGGPLCLYEALALGVPVISSDVGAAADYTTIIYKDLIDLKEKINGLIIPKNALEIEGKKLLNIFESLLAHK